jgi:hypothetical protein
MIVEGKINWKRARYLALNLSYLCVTSTKVQEEGCKKGAGAMLEPKTAV